jgi:hypothetical protein
MIYLSLAAFETRTTHLLCLWLFKKLLFLLFQVWHTFNQRIWRSVATSELYLRRWYGYLANHLIWLPLVCRALHYNLDVLFLRLHSGGRDCIYFLKRMTLWLRLRRLLRNLWFSILISNLRVYHHINIILRDDILARVYGRILLCLLQLSLAFRSDFTTLIHHYLARFLQLYFDQSLFSIRLIIVVLLNSGLIILSSYHHRVKCPGYFYNSQAPINRSISTKIWFIITQRS